MLTKNFENLEKSNIKRVRMILRQNEMIQSALQAFQIDFNIEEFVNTLKLVVNQEFAQPPEP